MHIRNTVSLFLLFNKATQICYILKPELKEGHSLPTTRFEGKVNCSVNCFLVEALTASTRTFHHVVSKFVSLRENECYPLKFGGSSPSA